MKSVAIKILMVIALLVLVLQIGSSAFALTGADTDSINLDSVWYKLYPKPTCGGGSAKPGPVYFVGDSIGTQVQSGLNNGFSSNGWTFSGNALSSRNLSGTPPAPDGLGAIDADQDFIKTANAVIIELGTNTGGFSPATVSQMVDKIRGLAPNAAIYWVDTAVVERQDYAQSLNNVNSILQTQSNEKGFKVISWNKKVFGDAADPANINASAPDNGYIRHADQFVHLTDQGVAAMTDLIVGVVTGTGGSDTPATNCVCGGSVTLVGSDNAEKAFHFFVSKGLTAIQAAGLMGNIQAESHFDTDIIEGGTGIGYGIAQWSYGRRTALEDAAAAAGVDVADLGFQLNYLYNESLGRDSRTYPGISEWEGLTKQETVIDATIYWQDNFERPDPAFAHTDQRIEFANGFLTQYGSTAPGGSGAGVCSSGGGN